jgi:hypothetical protein
MKNLTGKKITVTGNRSNHNIPMGTKLVLKYKNINSGNTENYTVSYCNSNLTIYLSDFKLVPMTKEDLNEEIVFLNDKKTQLDSEIQSINDKLDFITTNNIDVFDENQYKVFQTINTLNKPDISQIEKAKIIAALIDNAKSYK